MPHAAPSSYACVSETFTLLANALATPQADVSLDDYMELQPPPADAHHAWALRRVQPDCTDAADEAATELAYESYMRERRAAEVCDPAPSYCAVSRKRRRALTDCGAPKKQCVRAERGSIEMW